MKTLAPPTMTDRAEAAAAARALMAAIATPSVMGARSVLHIDYSRRRSEWIETWDGLPGFSRINGGRTYRHVLLPGWEYQRDEVKAEMIHDLEALAEHGVRPTEATRG